MKIINGAVKSVVFGMLILASMACRKESVASDVTDYSISEHWLSIPATQKQVDLFYFYPTAWHKESPGDPDICAIDNHIMLTGSKVAFGAQATAFETSCNIFAPYYRQADAGYTLSLPEDQRWEVIKGAPAKDVTAAFDYYIKHFNNGRPFILAGHSQGANVMLILLSEYMSQHPEVYNRMVAAYVIGYPVTAEYLTANPHLKFATGPDDTGVIISYNTQSPKVAPGANIVVANNVGLVINPITWTREETPATAAESLGSYMPDATMHFTKVPQFADAQVDIARGVLICSSVNDSAMYKMSSGMGLGVYHSFDYPFYYYNIRENAEVRVNKFLSNKR